MAKDVVKYIILTRDLFLPMNLFTIRGYNQSQPIGHMLSSSALKMIIMTKKHFTIKSDH